MTEKKRLGRPPGDDSKILKIEVRVTPAEKWRIRRLARASGMSVSELIRETLLKG